jgi:hypothetical protein
VQNSGKSGRGVKTMKSKEDGIASRETHENPAQGETRKVKRSLSPESRKRISDAQKKALGCSPASVASDLTSGQRR